MKFSLALFLLVAVSSAADAQVVQSNLSTYGSEFFLGFYEHVHTANTHRFYVLTKKTSSVSFSVTSLDGSFSYTGTTTYHNPNVVSVPATYEVRDRGYAWRRKGLRISSLETEPISVVAWSYRSSADFMSYLGQPCHEQPTTEYTYYVVSTLGWSNQMSQFLIVGCMNNTNITIVPNNNITVPSDPQTSGSANVLVRAGQSFKFVLHSLQTFFVFQPYVDLTGTKIVSDRPLTIISGHEASRVPQTFFDADPIVTQLTPTITWGRTFLLAPNAGRTNGQSYKIIAQDNDTMATRTCGPTGTVYNITFDTNNTAWFFTTANVYCSVVSSKPIYIAQIGVSTNYDGGSVGDPALYPVPPIDQYEHDIQITTFSQATSYYSVVVPRDQYFNNSLRINGFLQNVSFTSIYNSTNDVIGYGYASATSGSSTIQHPSSEGRLFVSVYGWTTYGGYGYAGGMKLNPINMGNRLPEITFTATEYTVNEADGMIYIYLERQVELDSNVSIRLYSNPSPVDTALVSQDYSSVSIVVYFDSGETVMNVSIPIINDLYAEPTEFFTLSIESLGDGDVVFPITETVIKIIDDDNIQIGFTSDYFAIDDGEFTTVNVKILNGWLEPGVSVPFQLRLSINNSDNSTDISCELSSFNPWTSFGLNLSQLSTFDSNMTQTISTQLWVPSAPVNVTLGATTVNIVPVIPFLSSSVAPMMMSSSEMPMLSSTDMMMYSSIVCYTSMMMSSSPMPDTSSIMPSSSIVSSSSSSISVPTTTVLNTVTQTVVQTATVCPSNTAAPVISNTPVISISTVTTTSISFVTTTTTRVTTSSICPTANRPSNSTAPTSTGGPTANKNALTQEVQVTGAALYFGILGFVLAIIFVFVVSVCCCIFCYQNGQKKGRMMEIKLEREIEMAANNPLYDDGASLADTVSYRSSLDEKKLLQYMQ